jgi:hypothetical protein
MACCPLSCARRGQPGNERGFDTRAAAALGPIVFRPELRDCGSQAFNFCSYRVAVGFPAHARIDTTEPVPQLVHLAGKPADLSGGRGGDRLLALFEPLAKLLVLARKGHSTLV